MKYKGITIIAGSRHTEKAVFEQIKDYIPAELPISTFSIHDKKIDFPKDNLLLITSCMIMDEVQNHTRSCSSENVIVANRTIGYDLIEQIFMIPENTDILFVNDVEETTLDGIQQLQKLGIDYLNFIPYYPGFKGEIKKVNIAITAGEVDKVPPFVEKVYNIGSRVLDFTTITKILTKLDILDEKAGLFSERYLQKIINIGKKISEYTNQIEALNMNMLAVMDGLSSGLLSYNSSGRILVCNDKLRKILRLQNQAIVGKNIRSEIYNKTLLQFLLNFTSEENRILDIYNESFLLKKISYDNDNILVVFKNMKATLDETSQIRSELVKKGFFAKYTLQDIKGSSPQMEKVRKIIGKFAPTDLSLLLEGESGTGKELVASAIHNASSRKHEPFIAVNFSALPDELVESELFGYEKGAFTGARKEGHIGIFEQADGGTIFLDEIGDISLKVQTKILRVLQEKEFMRVGGNEIKKVDVRVITATNRNLTQMIKNKEFREDLYYRLKIGYIHIPALRKRKNDIPEIMEHLVGLASSNKLKVSSQLQNRLIQYDWPGNVRELENTISYAVAMRESDVLTVNDLPDNEYFANAGFSDASSEEALIFTNDEIALLKMVYDLQKQGIIVGRENLAKESSKTDHQLTPAQVRTKLKKFQKLQLINQKRGKFGTVLTVYGETILNQHT